MEERLNVRNFDVTSSIIKVIGVGGGGSNAVNNMTKTGIEGVHFVVCNTDKQDLEKSLAATRIQLGESGLGAGSIADKGREAAEASREQIEQLLDPDTKMVFITASMGGGTGTGAAPVIAKIAKSKGILTVGIVTIPYLHELEQKIKQAILGVQQMQQSVDSLIIINNQLITKIYNDLDLESACAKADEISSNAAKSIAEIITIPGTFMNVDFADADTTLRDSGFAIMNSGMSQPGAENRVRAALTDALQSPFTDLQGIREAEHILLYFYYGANYRLTSQETGEINEFMNVFNKNQAKLIMGATCEDSIQDDTLKVTVICSGHNISAISEMRDMDLSDEGNYNHIHEALYSAPAKETTRISIEDYLKGNTSRTAPKAPVATPVKEEEPQSLEGPTHVRVVELDGTDADKARELMDL